MARCKAGNFTTKMLGPPPPYTRYEAYADGTAAIPKTEIVVTRPTTGRMRRRCCCAYCFVGILAIILGTFVIVRIYPYPLRASCIVKWGFNVPCPFVMQRLRYQILKWTSCNDCGHRGNRCFYSLKQTQTRQNTIRATHLNPNLNLVDDIRIEFEETRNNSCNAMAKSVSRAWFMIFDYGTNYCNLRNLVDDAGLEADRGFIELTNEGICTQFNTAVCI